MKLRKIDSDKKNFLAQQRRMERVLERVNPEMKNEREKMVDGIKLEIMQELGIPSWVTEAELPTQTMGIINGQARSRYYKIKEME